METTTATKPVRINRFLPYWAVFVTDVRQTMGSWVYRTWILISILTVVGFLLYRVGLYREAGIVQRASLLVGDLLRWSFIGSLTLIIVLAAGCISAERGTLADSVLSRGISRYHYFLGKWHARLATVVGTFLLMGAATLIASICFFHEDLAWSGSWIALVAFAGILAMIISGAVAVSALVNNSLVGITVVWITVYGCGLVLSLMPQWHASPYHLLGSLPEILRGEFNPEVLMQLTCYSLAASLFLAAAGIFGFSRKDV